ncbi:MAG TPA: hypothetical protein VFM68_03765 [Candidatus Saccharimonadales bacterium]|nr:hypothetical protein [Candidatus Saccharimonadales bacterium]
MSIKRKPSRIYLIVVVLILIIIAGATVVWWFSDKDPREPQISYLPQLY